MILDVIFLAFCAVDSIFRKNIVLCSDDLPKKCKTSPFGNPIIKQFGNQMDRYTEFSSCGV